MCKKLKLSGKTFYTALPLTIEARPQITEPVALPGGYYPWDCLRIWKVSANQRVQDILNTLVERNTRSSAQLC